MRVLVTRPAAQAAAWVDALAAHHVQATALPLIDIAPPSDPEPVRDAWQQLAQRDLVMFVSPNAAERFLAAADRAWPDGVHAAAPGPGTGAVLRAGGVPAGSVLEPAPDAAQFDSESLWAALCTRDWRGAKVLIVRGEGPGGRDWLGERLREAGARVDAVAAYRRVAPAMDAPQRGLLAAALAAPDAHVWLFSSSEAIDHLRGLVIEGGRAELAGSLPGAPFGAAVAIATHPRIAERAEQAGFARVLRSRPTVDAVVACLQSVVPAPPDDL